MKTVYSEKHRGHNQRVELHNGQIIPSFENAARIDVILDRIRETGLGLIESPADHGLDPLLRVHAADFVTFLQTAWNEWVASGAEGEPMPTIWRGACASMPTSMPG